MGDFGKGPWSAGLFEAKCPLCLFNYVCSSCSLGNISAKLSKPCGLPPIGHCLLACCGGGGLQILIFGHMKQADAEGWPAKIGKTWCCGLCYLHQQYKEHGCPEDPGGIIKGGIATAQQEMN